MRNNNKNSSQFTVHSSRFRVSELVTRHSSLVTRYLKNKGSVPGFALIIFVFMASFFMVESAQAAVSYIGASNLIATDGTAPGAITPNASTADGDLLVFYHYSRATGGNETVTL